MESPLTATRFGVVDYLREQLHGSDLGQAYAAWQALQQMIDDDSRKVSEAARRAIAEAAPRATPTELDLATTAESTVEAELQLTGPPIALTAVASSATPWLRVEQIGTLVRLSATPPTPGTHETSLLLAGPTGEHTIPIHLQTPEPEPESEPEPEPVQGHAAGPETAPAVEVGPEVAPEPVPESALAGLAALESPAEPASSDHEPPAQLPEATLTAEAEAEAEAEADTDSTSTPAPVAEPVTLPEPAAVIQPSTPRKPQPAASMARLATPPEGEPPARLPEATVAVGGPVSWWVVGGLAVGALLLFLMSVPGAAESRTVWSDEANTGWRVYRTWHEPEILGSVVAFVMSLVAGWSRRWAILALGIVAGCVVAVLENGVLILGGGIAGQEVGVWVAATAVAAGMTVVLLAVLRPRGLRLWPVDLPAAAFVVAGAVLLFINAGIRHPDGISFLDVTKLAPLEAFVVLSLGWLALAAVEPKTRLWLSATTSTYVLISIVASIPALTDGHSEPAFLTSVAGNVLAAVGMAIAARRPAPPASAAVQRQETNLSRWLGQHSWLTAVAIGIGALVLLLVNQSALDADLRLWYNTEFGSPDLQRHQADGTLAASIVTLLGALLAWRRGRLGAYSLGAAVGAATLFATAGVVILGGRISYEDNVYVWSISLMLAGLMLALVLAGPRATSYQRPDRATAVVLAAGFILLLIVQLLPDESGPSAATYTRGFALLLPIVAAALVLASTTTGDRTLVGAAASYLLLFALASLYPMSQEQAPDYFAAALLGHLVLLAALLLGVRRRKPAASAASAEPVVSL
jgi:hypothetical protein